ncbi:hypothetical protein BKA58DRAFT_400572 [Alternaria rosae]|uniref:uncharacterized protein n=1 Tax=Alternaria rosae TaxID=1187941 RepID=UPI001E8D53BB|nr:uncharacterized protein BKA58DRAFT_400572 [Alternaria rosae]KAH6872322.1 hypothetical protein BKA58DRAFT_400572 [Alternaria rosae]
MQLPNIKIMLARSQSTSKPRRPKKSRKSPTYSAGKHSCPPHVGDWLDTSLMGNELEQLLNFKVHAIFHVRDADEIDALYNSFHAQMRACQPLLPGFETRLRDHPLCEEVYKIYEDLTASGVAFSSLSREDWTRAKVLILYEDQNDKSITFQFINDTQEDLEAREHILELQRTVPANNVGIPRTARLRKWRDEWFVDMFGPVKRLEFWV